MLVPAVPQCNELKFIDLFQLQKEKVSCFISIGVLHRIRIQLTFFFKSPVVQIRGKTAQIRNLEFK